VTNSFSDVLRVTDVPFIKHVLIGNADDGRQPDNTQHLKTCQVVLLLQRQPVSQHYYTISFCKLYPTRVSANNNNNNLKIYNAHIVIH